MYDYWNIFGWSAAGQQARPDTAIAATRAYQFAKLKLNFEKYRQSKQKRPSRPTNYTLLNRRGGINREKDILNGEKMLFF